MIGPIVVTKSVEYRARMQFDDTVMGNATHLVWATGGEWFQQKRWTLT